MSATSMDLSFEVVELIASFSIFKSPADVNGLHAKNPIDITFFDIDRRCRAAALTVLASRTSFIKLRLYACEAPTERIPFSKLYTDMPDTQNDGIPLLHSYQGLRVPFPTTIHIDFGRNEQPRETALHTVTVVHDALSRHFILQLIQLVAYYVSRDPQNLNFDVTGLPQNNKRWLSTFELDIRHLFFELSDISFSVAFLMDSGVDREAIKSEVTGMKVNEEAHCIRHLEYQLNQILVLLQQKVPLPKMLPFISSLVDYYRLVTDQRYPIFESDTILGTHISEISQICVMLLFQAGAEHLLRSCECEVIAPPFLGLEHHMTPTFMNELFRWSCDIQRIPFTSLISRNEWGPAWSAFCLSFLQARLGFFRVHCGSGRLSIPKEFNRLSRDKKWFVQEIKDLRECSMSWERKHLSAWLTKMMPLVESLEAAPLDQTCSLIDAALEGEVDRGFEIVQDTEGRYVLHFGDFVFKYKELK